MSLTMSLQSFCSTPSTSTPTPNPSASPAPSSTLFLIHSNATSTNLSHHTHVIIIEKDDDQERINEMKAVFKTIQMIFCAIGVGGNILNLLTLRSRTLQTVPFMYIRSIAIFDLIGLSFIAIHFGLEQLPNDSYERTFYSTYFETTIINTFLVASCYCALMLTLERYILITHPHMRRPANPKRTARLRIVLLLLFTFILHSPMSAQNRIKFINGRWRKSNNVEFLCVEPIFSLYNYYKMSREFLRFMCVIAIAVLNVVIARKLQITKRNRRRMVHRPKASTVSIKFTSSDATCSDIYNADTLSTLKRESASLMRSFTEKKLTALMFSITFIFLIGNLPQIFVMVLQNEAIEGNFSFQLLRNIANALEVLNHCLNFYVFCMASSEYTRAFLLNCFFASRFLSMIPACARFIYTTKPSSCITSQRNSIMRILPTEVLLSDNDATAVDFGAVGKWPRNGMFRDDLLIAGVKRWSDGDQMRRMQRYKALRIGPRLSAEVGATAMGSKYGQGIQSYRRRATTIVFTTTSQPSTTDVSTNTLDVTASNRAMTMFSTLEPPSFLPTNYAHANSNNDNSNNANDDNQH